MHSPVSTIPLKLAPSIQVGFHRTKSHNISYKDISSICKMATMLHTLFSRLVKLKFVICLFSSAYVARNFLGLIVANFFDFFNIFLQL